MSDVAEGATLEQQYRSMGANDDQINEWKSGRVQEFRKLGANDQQINDYFGVKQPDTSDMKAYVQKNIDQFKQEQAGDGTKPKEATSFMEALDAGWENGITGLAKAGHLPDTVLPEHAGFMLRMASQIGQTAGDLPTMLAGGYAGMMAGAPVGGAIGSLAGPIGTLGGIAAGSAVGAGAGAFAAPAGIRRMLMEHYERPDGFKDPGDFMAALAASSYDAAKGAVVGGLTAGTGALVKPVAGAAAGFASELGVMTTAGAAMQGRLPDPQEFLDGAILLGGLHAAGATVKGVVDGTIPAKLREIYAKTGERPAEVVEATNNNVELKQKLLSEDPANPTQAAKQEATPEETAPPAEPPKSGGEPPSDEEMNLDAAKAKIDSHMGKETVAETPSWTTWDGFKDNITKFKDKLYTAAVNKFSPLESFQEASGEDQGPESAATRAYNYRGWMGKLQRTFQANTIDFKTGEVTGEGLLPILKDIPKERQADFVRFWASDRALEREQSGENQEGKETGFDLDAAKIVRDAGEKEFRPIMDRFNAFDARMLKYAKDSQLISADSYANLLTKSHSYMPLDRVMDDDQFLGEPPKGSRDAGEIFKFMKGSERTVKDNPMQLYFQKLGRLFEAAERNSVPNAFVDTVESAQSEIQLAEKVENPRGAKNEFTFKRDGEQVTYKTFPEYAGALNSIQYDPAVTGIFLKVLSLPAKTLRTLTVEVPDFITRHFTRQVLSGNVYSSEFVNPMKAVPDMLKYSWNSVTAIGRIWNNSESYQNFLSSGATAGELGNVMKYFEKQGVWDLNKETGNWMDKTWNVIRKPFEALGYAAYVSDVAPRLAEFEKSGGVDTGTFGKEGYQPASAEAKAQAAANAREVTLDYDRSGNDPQLRTLKALTPFINIGIQGVDRLRRGFQEDPVGFSTKAAMAITAPTVLNWLYAHKDSRYQSAPAWEKDLYWLIPFNKWEPGTAQDALSRPEDLRKQNPDGSWMVNNGTMMKISKPFELGIIFGSFPERLLNKFVDQDTHGMSDYGQTVMHGLIPNVMPTFAVPAIEQAANYNFFKGRPIVPDHLQNVAPEMQYNEYTSGIAKTIGHALGYVPGMSGSKFTSPMIIDNWIHDYAGTGGQYLIRTADAVYDRTWGSGKNGAPAAMTLADYPVIKAFISRNPGQNVQDIQDFYDQYNHAQMLENTAKTMEKQGLMDQAAQYREANLNQMYRLNDIHKALGVQAALIKQINVDPRYDATEKRQLIDTSYYQMWTMARAGNQVVQQLKAKR